MQLPHRGILASVISMMPFSKLKDYTKFDTEEYDRRVRLDPPKFDDNISDAMRSIDQIYRWPDDLREYGVIKELVSYLR